MDVGGLLRPSLAGLGMQPADGVVCLPPEKLSWDGIHWAESYDVYLGGSKEGVVHAEKDSREYLGNAEEPQFVLPKPLAAGAEYFWRRDVITRAGTVKGKVMRFLASKVSLDKTHLSVASLSGHPGIAQTVDLESASPGQPWRATSREPWIRFKGDAGKTPGDLEVVFDATDLTPGEYSGSIQLHVDCTKPVTIPVAFSVTPLALTHLESRQGSPLVYGITEASPKTKPLRGLICWRSILAQGESPGHWK